MQKTEQKKVWKTLQKESGIFKMASTADAVSIQLNISTIISGFDRLLNRARSIKALKNAQTLKKCVR